MWLECRQLNNGAEIHTEDMRRILHAARDTFVNLSFSDMVLAGVPRRDTPSCSSKGLLENGLCLLVNAGEGFNTSLQVVELNAYGMGHCLGSGLAERARYTAYSLVLRTHWLQNFDKNAGFRPSSKSWTLESTGVQGPFFQSQEHWCSGPLSESLGL